MAKRPVKKQIKPYTYRRKDGRLIKVPSHPRTYYMGKKKRPPAPTKQISKKTICDECGLKYTSACEVCEHEHLLGRKYVEEEPWDEEKEYIIQQKPEDMSSLYTFKEIHGDKYEMSGFSRSKEESMDWVKEKRRIGRKAYLVPVYDKVGSGYAFYAEKAFD